MDNVSILQEICDTLGYSMDVNFVTDQVVLKKPGKTFKFDSIDAALRQMQKLHDAVMNF